MLYFVLTVLPLKKKKKIKKFADKDGIECIHLLGIFAQQLQAGREIN